MYTIQTTGYYWAEDAEQHVDEEQFDGTIFDAIDIAEGKAMNMDRDGFEDVEFKILNEENKILFHSGKRMTIFESNQMLKS